MVTEEQPEHRIERNKDTWRRYGRRTKWPNRLAMVVGYAVVLVALIEALQPDDPPPTVAAATPASTAAPPRPRIEAPNVVERPARPAPAPSVDPGIRVDDKMVDTLVTIARPVGSERASTRERFAFILPRIVESCSDVRSQSQAGDRLATVRRMMKEGGLERAEPFLELSNNLYRVSRLAGSNAGGTVACTPLWAMYVTLRTEGGFPAGESVESIVALQALGEV